MSVATSSAESRVVLTNISWSTFEAILAETDRRSTRFTYDRGVLEIMSPSREHERLKRMLGRMVEGLTEELEIPISSASATTLKSQMKQKGVEPDESYYIAQEARVRGRDDLDLAVDRRPTWPSRSTSQAVRSTSWGSTRRLACRKCGSATA